MLLFFLLIELYFFIPAAIAQIFNPIAELVIPIGILSKKAKAEIQIHPVTVEPKNLGISLSCLFVIISELFLRLS